MRDIKFRGWDTVGEIMLPVEQIFFTGKFISLEQDDNSLTDTFEMIELLQYTGLKDVDGKEIYEGDIVELVNFSENKSYAKIVFSFGMFKLIGRGHYLLEGDGISLYTIRKIRVIGNIFENPELLTN